jgi:hypothetical protein
MGAAVDNGKRSEAVVFQLEDKVRIIDQLNWRSFRFTYADVIVLSGWSVESLDTATYGLTLIDLASIIAEEG